MINGYRKDKEDGKTVVKETRKAAGESPASYAIEIARAPTVHNITLEQALEDLKDAQAVVDDIQKLNK